MEAALLKELQALIIAAGTAAPEDTTLVPSNMNVIRNELYADYPFRSRGLFETGSMKDFNKYYARHGTTGGDRADVFIDTEEGFAATYFDRFSEGKPGWAENKAVLKLDRTPEFIELHDFVSDAHNQRQTLEFIADMSQFLSFTGNEDREIKNGLVDQALRSMKKRDETIVTNNVADFAESGSVMNEVNIASSTDNLPIFMTVKLPTYDGFDDHTRVYRVSINLDDLTIRFKQIQRHLVIEQIKSEMLRRLGEAVNEENIFCGSYVSLQKP